VTAGRTARDRPVDRSGGRAGEQVRLEVGPVAHGGSCVARLEGRVVFVRHALPGEEVLARLTEAREQDRYWRADAVEVLRASPDRVEPPCPLARPGLCGGCDWQHAALPAQRELKTAVVVEQLRRLAGLDVAALWPDFTVEPVPGDVEGLGWRTRMRFTVDAEGRPGLHPHRSHDLVPVEHCPIAHPEVNRVGVGRARWPGVTAIEVAAAPPRPVLDDGEPEPQRLVVVDPAGAERRVDVPPLAAPAAVARRVPAGLERVRGRTWLEEQVTLDGERRAYRVTGSGFWQVHAGAAQTLLDAVLGAAGVRAGERVLDLFCGAGLFTAGLAAAVGLQGSVVGIESDARAVADARRSLHDLPQVRVTQGRVDARLAWLVGDGQPLDAVDVVVLDPPRAGAGRGVTEAVLALRPRVVVYVACDPASLARDLGTAAGLGYRAATLRAFDLFPMTHHVECVATLVPA